MTLTNWTRSFWVNPNTSKPQDINITNDQFTSVVAVDTETYRRYYDNKSVKNLQQKGLSSKKTAPLI